MADFARFVLFSMVETLAATSIILALFRFKITDYIWPALAINFIMGLQSYVLREELTLSFLAPIINLILISFFIVIIIRVPLIWSLFMTFCGYVVSILIQAITVAISGRSVEWFQAVELRGYILQVVTGIIVFTLSFVLYKFGIGLSFEFKKFRFKSERAMIVAILLIMTVSFGVLLYYREVYIDVLFLLVSLLFFAYYAVRKETENDDLRSGSENSIKH